MTTALVAHDAGGAEILSSYVRRHRPSVRFVLEGPARAIFERKLGSVEHVPLNEAAATCDRLLCGTSWQSDLELEAIATFREHEKPSSAFLDHWTNFAARFRRRDRVVLPDELWVGDIHAERLAKQELGNIPVRVVENPYLLDIKEELASTAPVHESDASGSPVPRGLRVLYVCEPFSEVGARLFGNPRHWGYDEEEALRYFLEHVEALGEPVGMIRIRPHPSESPDKYAWACRVSTPPVVVAVAGTLVAEVRASDVVVGAESMALVVALLGGKRVISSVPPHGRPCALPFPEIESLQALSRAPRT